MKLNSTFNCLWAYPMGSSTSSDELHGVAVDSKGRVAFAGSLGGTGGNVLGKTLASDGGATSGVAFYGISTP